MQEKICNSQASESQVINYSFCLFGKAWSCTEGWGKCDALHFTQHCCRLSKTRQSACRVSLRQTLPRAVSGGWLYWCLQVLVQHGSQQEGSKVPTPQGMPDLPLGEGAHLSEIDLCTEVSQLSLWNWLHKSFLCEVF